MFTKRTILQNNFNLDYKKTSLQEREIIDNIKGPVRVIAAPGINITRIAVLRIGKILSKAGALPQNILCFTGTDASAVTLQKQLERVIGPDAFKVNIYTVPAFCEKLIRYNVSLFENKLLLPVSILENVQLFKKLITGFPGNH